MKKLDVQTDQKSKRLILIGHIWISLTSFDWFLSMTLMFLSFCCVDATHPPAGRGGQKAAQTGMLQGCQQSEESHKSLLSTKNFQHRPSISSIYPFPSILDPYSIHIPSIFHPYSMVTIQLGSLWSCHHALDLSSAVFINHAEDLRQLMVPGTKFKCIHCIHIVYHFIKKRVWVKTLGPGWYPKLAG